MWEIRLRGHQAGDGGAGLKPADSKLIVCLSPTLGTSPPVAQRRRWQSMISGVISGHKGWLFTHKDLHAKASWNQKILLVATLAGPARGHDFSPAMRHSPGRHGLRASAEPSSNTTAKTNSCPCPLLLVTSQGSLQLRWFTSSLPKGFRLCPTYWCPGDLEDKEVNHHQNKD